MGFFGQGNTQFLFFVYMKCDFYSYKCAVEYADLMFLSTIYLLLYLFVIIVCFMYKYFIMGFEKYVKSERAPWPN